MSLKLESNMPGGIAVWAVGSPRLVAGGLPGNSEASLRARSVEMDARLIQGEVLQTHGDLTAVDPAVQIDPHGRGLIEPLDRVVLRIVAIHDQDDRKKEGLAVGQKLAAHRRVVDPGHGDRDVLEQGLRGDDDLGRSGRHGPSRGAHDLGGRRGVRVRHGAEVLKATVRRVLWGECHVLLAAAGGEQKR